MRMGRRLRGEYAHREHHHRLCGKIVLDYIPTFRKVYSGYLKFERRFRCATRAN